MIRFGVVLTVVVAALGLLVAGILTSSLLLTYLAIGVAVLSALMLIIDVVVWRDEVFGGAAAGKAAVEKTAAVPAGVASGGRCRCRAVG